MSPRRDRSPLSSPILIGALTVLAVIVAVFLAYNANSGLPFVPSYSLHVQVADANELTHGAEVHMGGALVGFVDTVQPTRSQDGQPIAVLGLKLNRSIGRLPVDSTFTIRLKGSIGQKYLAVVQGSSQRTYADGTTILISEGSEFQYTVSETSLGEIVVTMLQSTGRACVPSPWTVIVSPARISDDGARSGAASSTGRAPARHRAATYWLGTA